MITHITEEATPFYLKPRRLVDISWYQDNVGPHAETTRGTYTVPAGKMARLVGFFGFIMRGTPPTTTGIQRLRVYIQRGDNTTFVLTNVYLYNATTGALTYGFHSIDLFLNENEKVLLTSVDASSGGNGHYVANVTIEEYPA